MISVDSRAVPNRELLLVGRIQIQIFAKIQQNHECQLSWKFSQDYVARWYWSKIVIEALNQAPLVEEEITV